MTRRAGTLSGLLVATAVSILQPVHAAAAERVVLAENFTATWCVYCPYAGRAINRMLNEMPTTFTSVQIHGGDAYAISWGATREAFYGVGGYPTVWFDGQNRAQGAYTNDTSQYNWFMSIYNTCRARPTDVTLVVGGEPVSGQTYRITARIGVEPTGTAKTVRLYFAHVLDYYPYSADNRYRNCLRTPGVATNVVTLQPGAFQEVSRTFTFDSTSWANQSNIKIIVWAQVNNPSGPAAVHNAYSLNWPFQPLPPLWQRGDMNCDGVVDFDDIDPFVLALNGQAGYEAAFPNCVYVNADCNNDQAVNFDDIEAFVALLTG